MDIKFIDIQNYRKLKSSRIYLSEDETLFVGANNSGKTSAIDALIIFLDQRAKGNVDNEVGGQRRFYTTDFTLSNWGALNHYAKTWLDPKNIQGTTLYEWQPLCPSLDIWLKVDVSEIHRVSHLVPTLKWRGGLLGVRLIYQPRSMENLMADFLAEYKSAKDATESLPKPKEGEEGTKLELWPRDLREFLNKRLGSYFELKAYLLNPENVEENDDPQRLPEDHLALKTYPFKDLFKVDVIAAQRGFSDPYSNSNVKGEGSLSSQLNQYYSRHLNPSEHPRQEDVKALAAIDKAKNIFDEQLNISFNDALSELKGLGYPGFNDPDILLSSNLDPVENLAHTASVIFDVQKPESDTDRLLALPETYNGLGYKNLIYMIFKLIGFRDNWMRKGKAEKRGADENIAKEPLHLVLIEEPEAHLHAQVQQVFIRKAFEVLRHNVPSAYSTQMVVSSHSSYIAHEVGFEKLRYFKRNPSMDLKKAPTAEVVGLSDVFGNPKTRTDGVEETAKFVTRYLKTTHCDLFFANGVILVEGAAERMLLPHFIRYKFDDMHGLNRSYISILEVGGAHAQRLKPLIDALNLPTLVITDTDATGEKIVKIKDKDVTVNGSVRPKRGVGQSSGSNTLKQWFEFDVASLDDVLDKISDEKILGNSRVAYQYDIAVKYDGKVEESAVPYTFEDALALSNIDLIKAIKKPTGMMKKMKDACEEATLDECAQAMYEALDNNGKAKMALDIIFDIDPEKLKVPHYINEGLEWLQTELLKTSRDFLLEPSTDLGNVS
ncbi:AAA family ATPase [Teredinibacter turnerae]|uniref:AAA family ATPase n=1 Tax=Teredinibacter turnerae TaxID=2426 RepID=UPI000380E330|nr:AAA family ATPase [Teredinibacter turnerae]